MPIHEPLKDGTVSTTQTAQTEQPVQTEQTSIRDEALVADVLNILENDREVAAIVHRRERFYRTRLKVELQDRYGWDVDKDAVEAAVEEIGPETVRFCAHPHPGGR